MWGFFTRVSRRVKFSAFAGYTTVSKKLSIIASQLQVKTPQHRKHSCIALLTLINRHYTITWPKTTSTFKEQTKIALQLTIEKIGCRQRRLTFQEFLLISVHAVAKSRKRGIFQQKIPNIFLSWSTRFCNFIAKVFVTQQHCKISTHRLTYRWKKLNPTNNAAIFTNTKSKTQSVPQFLQLWLNNIWAPGPRHGSTTRSSSLF